MDDATVIKIGATLTIHQVNLAYQEWLPLLPAAQVKIDASEVRELDCSGLQLIYYLMNTVQSHNGQILWQPKPSGYFIDLINFSGMSKIFAINQGEES